MRIDGTTYIFHPGKGEKQMAAIWRRASAVIMYNAPYDLGVLSSLDGNAYSWFERGQKEHRISNWRIVIFGCQYEVKRITNFRNVIRNGKQAPPVIDLLKLWSLLIDDGEGHSISLKAVASRVLGVNMIPWSPENALTREYQAQDVEILERLWLWFVEQMAALDDVAGLSLQDFANIKTPASFSKMMYERTYPDLKQWKKDNDKAVKALKLSSAFEKAYHGGITLSLYRGKVKNVAWVDIKGAYSTAIMTLNTDQYLKYDIVKAPEYTTAAPLLCRIRSNFLFKTINHGLKMFATSKLCVNWMWNYDIEACRLLYPGYKVEIIDMFAIVPLNDVPASLCHHWIEQKNKAVKGSTLYTWFKYCSNTSYGIKAQRYPFQTTHTNMAIAGMITSRVHLCLAQIKGVIEAHGYRNLYHDTDSCGFLADETYTPGALVAAINDRIAPFEVEHDGFYQDAEFISLKRYICTRGDKKDKIRVHGRGRYNVTARHIMDFVKNAQAPDGKMELRQLSANTPLTMRIMMRLYEKCTIFVFDGSNFVPLHAEISRHRHPFMFMKSVPTERTFKEFLSAWYTHIDVKTSWQKTNGKGFFRNYHRFYDDVVASRAFEHFARHDDEAAQDSEKRFWDNEIIADFGIKRR